MENSEDRGKSSKVVKKVGKKITFLLIFTNTNLLSLCLKTIPIARHSWSACYLRLISTCEQFHFMTFELD